MSVYTVVTLDEVQPLAAHYAWSVRELIPIQAGIENTNYFVQIDQPAQTLVLTIFEQMSLIDINELLPLLTYLKQQGIPVAAALADQNGQCIHAIKNKPAQFAPRLSGQHPLQPTLAQVSQMASTLARLHVTLFNYPLHRDNNHGQAWWQASKDELIDQLQPDEQALLQQVFDQFKQVQQQYPQRPSGLIHGDLFRDNSLFDGDELTGVLDFSELSVDELLLDIAICLNDFCSDWPQVTLDQAKAQAFIAAYHQHRPLTSDERAALPTYLAMAACRFWLSRVQVQTRNQQENRQGEHVLQKDPDEMRRMVQARLDFPFLSEDKQ
ncbi:MAG: homoserine kinase [Moraxellaceae bacterium]|nr:MAG: homoserine kinase [Moraxellaceae bacterium]